MLNVTRWINLKLFGGTEEGKGGVAMQTGQAEAVQSCQEQPQNVTSTQLSGQRTNTLDLQSYS